MALLAIRAKATAMDIVAGVAIHAALRGMSRVSQALLVAQTAGELLMGTLQGIVGGLIVIEAPADPCRRVVTSDTTLAERTLVGIITLMAITTGFEGLVKGAGEMAALAG